MDDLFFYAFEKRKEECIVGKKLYVGNLPYGMTTDQLRDLFAQQGEVEDAIVLTDRETNRSRGFGFVTYNSDSDAQKAIDALNGFEVEGRGLKVNEARERPAGGGGGGGFRGGPRGGNGGGGRGPRGGGGRGGDRY